MKRNLVLTVIAVVLLIASTIYGEVFWDKQTGHLVSETIDYDGNRTRVGFDLNSDGHYREVQTTSGQVYGVSQEGEYYRSFRLPSPW